MKRANSWRRILLVAFALPIASLAKAQTESAPAEQLAVSPEQQQLYAKLEESLTGAALVGKFSVTGDDSGQLREERYELKSVKHVGGDQWLFNAGIRYGEHDVVIPLTLPVKWAGDTPVISIDQMMIPGLGTYTARVMIYDDHYVGFWSGGDHGGHMFGLVERSESNDDETPPNESSPHDQQQAAPPSE